MRRRIIQIQLRRSEMIAAYRHVGLVNDKPRNTPTEKQNHTKYVTFVEGLSSIRVIGFSFCSCTSWFLVNFAQTAPVPICPFVCPAAIMLALDSSVKGTRKQWQI
jgi:hypothetical protein